MFDAAQRRIDKAVRLPDVLDAARAAFEAVLAAINDYQAAGAPFHAALVMAAAPAADGRDAVAIAPSMPTQAATRLPVADWDRAFLGPDVAPAIVALADAVWARLRQAASLAVDAEDVAACDEGAAYASEVRELIAGPRP